MFRNCNLCNYHVWKLYPEFALFPLKQRVFEPQAALNAFFLHLTPLYLVAKNKHLCEHRVSTLVNLPELGVVRSLCYVRHTTFESFS